MSTPKCLTEKCTNPSAPALKRGLCMNCHSKARKMVENGVTTWDNLVGLGLAAAADENGADPFTEAYNKLTKGNNANGNKTNCIPEARSSDDTP